MGLKEGVKAAWRGALSPLFGEFAGEVVDATPRERELYAIIERLEARIAEQDARIAELQAKLARAKRDSSNSSKPPSSREGSSRNAQAQARR